MTEIDLSAFAITRPEKVRWIFPHQYTDPLDAVRSDSLRKFLRTSLQLLKDNDISFEYGPVTKEQYELWYEFYEQNMEEREYSILASKNLIEEKESESKQVEGIFLHKDGSLIGGGIIVRRGNELASLAYKASLRLSISNKKNSSLGAIIDYLFLTQMKAQGITGITGGRSRNAFGVLNSLGHLEYKLRFGYDPAPDKTVPVLSSVPIDERGSVVFVGVKDGQKGLFFLKRKDVDSNFDFPRFDLPELPYHEIELENV